ncbi:phosphotransferase [Actinopolymorpha singaporensis]|uniref:Phosphotransferase enzyme family protein n=1 Tax=Actinopolymorpha singaporensis TaxID=117157 RepID=A0A1H1U2L6_9ACTN|nr:phosphotransferase [Actinopolymorpha singaporensis]SDS66634.1 Phosphotransferase enzyme family protein [Actinopolymorpha singaporensis]
MTGYWDVEPSGRSAPTTMQLSLPDVQVELRADRGVFAASGIDRGTRVLLRDVAAPNPYTGVVDLGTGYGPIAVATALRQPLAGVWAVDVNRRALDLTRANTRDLPNVVVAEPGDVPPSLRFGGLYSNPPIKIGKDALHQLLADWLARLDPGSRAWLVVKQAMGADSLQRWLSDGGFPTSRAASKQGYRILRVDTPGPPPPLLEREDLATIAAHTGGPWTVLGRLTGGYSDTVVLVGRGALRAVLKAKEGAWWREQLNRLVPVSQELRTLGYPTPEVIGCGSLSADRSYLLTSWAGGTSPTEPNRRQLDAALAAAELHRSVRPPADRDWSAMITAFLNGGIGEHEFHPATSAYARQALAVLPKPVPALPTGELTHGDFTFRNMLFDGDALSAVVDLEGFGTGTVAADLLALLPSLSDPDHRRVVVEHAGELTSADVVAACLCHRILAGLDWASQHVELLDDAIERAKLLLSLLP